MVKTLELGSFARRYQTLQLGSAKAGSSCGGGCGCGPCSSVPGSAMSEAQARAVIASMRPRVPGVGSTSPLQLPWQRKGPIRATSGPTPFPVGPHGEPFWVGFRRARPVPKVPRITFEYPTLAGPDPDPDEEYLCSIRSPPECDNCGFNPCRGVQVRGSIAMGTDEWAAWCELGDPWEEAMCACLCAGGTETFCRNSAETARLDLGVVNGLFGGEPPMTGTRYYDLDGLPRRVDEFLSKRLRLSYNGPQMFRCGPPDPVAAEATYAARQQRCRMSRFTSCR